MEFLIITGLSGAGKSRAADILEDLDYYCVDNMPVALMPRFAELCIATGGRYEKVALVTDVREKDGFGELLKTLDELNAMDCGCRILYMDCDMDLLAPIRERADFIVNSSNLTLGMLQNKLFSLFAPNGEKREIDVTVMSFGYKHGLPMDADLVFDVRFLPNPYYVEDLRPLCGLDRPVRDYVFGYQQTREFMNMLENMIEFLLPLYIEEGKLGLTIAIGCTGGRHRSVAIAAALNDHLLSKGMDSTNINRDLDK